VASAASNASTASSTISATSIGSEIAVPIECVLDGPRFLAGPGEAGRGLAEPVGGDHEVIVVEPFGEQFGVADNDGEIVAQVVPEDAVEHLQIPFALFALGDVSDDADGTAEARVDAG